MHPWPSIMLVGRTGVGKSTLSRRLESLLRRRGIEVHVIEFDRLRKILAEPHENPFAPDLASRRAIYRRAAALFAARIRAGEVLIIDSATSLECLRVQVKSDVPGLVIVHLQCGLARAAIRETIRSLKPSPHERGRFLYLRAFFDLLRPWKYDKFFLPGVTAVFEYPNCADLHVTSYKPTQAIAEDVIWSLSGAERSRLYAPTFDSGYRAGS